MVKGWTDEEYAEIDRVTTLVWNYAKNVERSINVALDEKQKSKLQEQYGSIFDRMVEIENNLDKSIPFSQAMIILDEYKQLWSKLGQVCLQQPKQVDRKSKFAMLRK